MNEEEYKSKVLGVQDYPKTETWNVWVIATQGEDTQYVERVRLDRFWYRVEETPHLFSAKTFLTKREALWYKKLKKISDQYELHTVTINVYV